MSLVSAKSQACFLRARTARSKVSVTVRAFFNLPGPGSEASEGVKNLLARDAKKLDAAPKDDLFQVMDTVKKIETEQGKVETEATLASQAQAQQRRKGRRSKRAAGDMSSAAAAEAAGAAAVAAADDEDSGPVSTSEAIRLGLERYQQGKHKEAIEMFELSLELPGNGMMRMAGSIREIACPSDGEEQAALYNMACAYAALGQVEAGITCLRGALEAGLEDFATVRSDKDLEPLRRSPEFNKVVGEFDNPIARAKRALDSRDAVPTKKGLGRFYLPW